MAECYMKLVNKAMASAALNGTSFEGELQAAVRAHNSSAHSITKIPPEEMMSGRKIRRNLPLLVSKKVHLDEEAINERDREAKLRGKEREDARRGARECSIKPGDKVIVQKQTRSKGDCKFGSTKYTVIEQTNGNLILEDDEGLRIKRHVSQTKQVRKWRGESPDPPQPRNIARSSTSSGSSNSGRNDRSSSPHNPVLYGETSRPGTSAIPLQPEQDVQDTSSEETRPAAQLQPAGIDQRSCSPKLAQPGQEARPSRKKQVPSYLQDYVRLVEEELEVQKTLQI
ncbi:uncharacterized protein LOC120422132 [Culex pipiens pallens]|uniref:uncharacterized protein LOC120422132 n=1 Tax=Culex pipiens pallens TaxID=42434 RepID=UPI001953042B|nr:uncharacterized protein LOC120422132 [Culex pipiens pallens]